MVVRKYLCIIHVLYMNNWSIARMNETTYQYWINRAMRADVSSTRTTTLVAGLPPTDDDEVVARLLDLSFAERD